MSNFKKVVGQEKGSPKEIIERMKLAYGVSSNVELSKLIETPVSTMSNWLSRDSVPFRYVYECAQVTGKDVDWLLNGKLANANYGELGASGFTGDESIYGRILQSGGQQLLQRLLMAYGFTMQKQLGDLLGLSSGTISTWVRRNHFPGDVVVACALDTGVDLRWLSTGVGSPNDNQQTVKNAEPYLREIPFFKLEDGGINNMGSTHIDTRVFHGATKPSAFVTDGVHNWYADLSSLRLGNGKFLINIDGYIDAYDVIRLPGNKIKVSKESTSFECAIDDVSCVGQILTTLTTV